MKTLIKLILFSTSILCLETSVFSQKTDWVVYANSERVNCQLIQGNYNWVGTNGGIVRININTGKKEFINMANSDLQSNFINCLAADINENLWVGSDRFSNCGGLSSFKGENWFYYDLPENYTNINSITVANENDIWIDIDLSGLLHYNGSEWVVFNKENSILPTNSFKQIIIEGDSVVWAIAEGNSNMQGGLAKYNGSNWVLFDTSNSGIPTNSIYSMAIDKYGNKWVGTNKGLAMFDGSNWIVFNTENSQIPSNIITSVVCDENNFIWVGTYNSGLAFYDFESWTIYNKTNSMLPANRIKSIDVDQNNTLWIIYNLENYLGSRIVSFNGSEWVKHETNIYPMLDNIPTCLALDPDSSVWVGTRNGFANIKNEDWKVFTTENTPLKDVHIKAMAFESNGAKWFGSNYYGLIKYFNNEWTVYTKENSPLSSEMFNCITIDKSNNKWIGTIQDGLIRFSHDDSWTTFNESNSELPSNTVSNISIDKSGIVWIGTWNGLVKIENDIWTVYDTVNSDLPDNNIMSLAFDSTNNLWIGTQSEGLVKYDSQNWTIYNKENSGITNNYVWTVAVDIENNVWFSATNGEGLTKFDGTDFTIFDCANSGISGLNTTKIIIDYNNTKWIRINSGYNRAVALYNEKGFTGVKKDDDIAETKKISLFPNPVNNCLHVDFDSEYEQILISISDVTGKQIRIISLKSNQKTIDVSKLPSGLYIISATFKNNCIATNKFIKY